MNKKEQALQAIQEKAKQLCEMSDFLWDHPEIGYHEEQAAKLYCETLEKEGFEVSRELAGIKTAFSGRYGSGKPVLGILAEFDALPGLSQMAGSTVKQPVEAGKPGHGCGHNLLGIGSLAAALAVKRYLQESGTSGTVIFFGCPAEEGGAGKGFMARDGVFDCLDAAISWHPGETNSVATEATMANCQICYHFYGVSSHAAMSPELGRSALDALELMNTGVQYLREHMPMDNRIHYAITDTGGSAPGIVQPYAEALYLIRAPKLNQVKALRERVDKIANGAAMMTETRVEIEFVKACSDMVLNTTLNQVLQKNMEEQPRLEFDEEDRALAHAFRQTMKGDYSYYNELLTKVTDPQKRSELEQQVGADLYTAVFPLLPESQGFASSDVGDVSNVCPVGQIGADTMPAGTSMHSWQEVAVGKTPMAHKGMLYAGKVMGAALIDLFDEPALVEKAKEEHNRRMGGKKFVSAIPKDVKPRIPK